MKTITDIAWWNGQTLSKVIDTTWFNDVVKDECKDNPLICKIMDVFGSEELEFIKGEYYDPEIEVYDLLNFETLYRSLTEQEQEIFYSDLWDETEYFFECTLIRDNFTISIKI
jgi:hypothetical protein